MESKLPRIVETLVEDEREGITVAVLGDALSSNKIEADNAKLSEIEKKHNAKYITDAQMGPVYNTLAMIHLAKGEVSFAYEYFKQASRLRPDFVEAMLNEASIAINVQDFNSAYDLYTKVHQLQPNNLDAYLSLAVAARGKGDFKEAEKIYREVLTNNPEHAPTQFNLAVLYHEYTNDLTSAKTHYEAFVKANQAAELYPVAHKQATIRIKQINEALEAQKNAPPPTPATPEGGGQAPPEGDGGGGDGGELPPEEGGGELPPEDPPPAN